MSTGEDQRRRDVETGRRGQAALLAGLARQVDPDGTMDPEERARRAEEARLEHLRKIAGRGGRARVEIAKKARKARPAPAKAPVTVAKSGGPGSHAPPRRTASVSRPGRALWDRPDVRAALAAHDIGGLYRLLGEEGFSQRWISTLVGQSQSEVAELRSGRRNVVMSYAVLDRIATGLGIPRELMGLGWSAFAGDGAYSGGVTVASPGGVEEMLRRHLLAVAGLSAFGAVVPGLGELHEDGPPMPPMPGEVPGRIGAPDVQLIRDWGTQVRTLARVHGGEGRASVALAGWADQWLEADASEPVRRDLLAALSEVHTTAAWCCHDSGAVERSHWHFGRAVELATDADDAYRAAYALRHAAMMLIERGHPNDGLKAIQMSAVRLDAAAPDEPRVPELRAWCHGVRALALSRLEDGREATGEQARSAMAQAREWKPDRPWARATMDLDTAHTWLHLGELDRAEALAARSVQGYAEGVDRREGVLADLALARLHVTAGEPRGLTLARDAIGAVTETRSAVARQVWLPPLAEALESRPGSEAAELAARARQVAA